MRYGDEIKKDQVMDKASVRVRRLVKAVGREVVNRKGLIATLGLRQQGIRNFRMNYMIPAREQGYVVMQYAGAPHYHDQAYKLTQKGLDYLAEIEAQEKDQLDRGMDGKKGPSEIENRKKKTITIYGNSNRI